MVSLKIGWRFQEKKHIHQRLDRPYIQYTSPLYPLWIWGELNAFINPNFDLLVLPDSPWIQNKHHSECGVPTGCVELPQKKLHLFKTPRLDSFINDSSQLSSHERISILPSMFLCWFPKLLTQRPGVILLFPKNTPKRHTRFIHSPFQPLEGPMARWSLGFPCFFNRNRPGHKLATWSFGHGQRNQWCKQYEARIAFGTRF